MNNTLNDADYVISSYISSDYTIWYRKYKSGWVEQGGGLTGRNQTISFPIPMANTNYTALCNTNSDQGYARNLMSSNTTTSIYIRADGGSMWWYVCGQAA